MELTESETKFETHCAAHGLILQRIERESEKTPDYELTLGSSLIAVEVKELTPNDTDRANWKQLRESRSVAAYCNSADRLREKILKGCRQLRRRTRKSRPAILVVYDNHTFDGVDFTDIKNAMYGSETWRISESAAFTEITPRLGAGQMCTPIANTTLSAVALLAADDLICFHNVHAASPLDRAAVRSLCSRQFTIDLSLRDRLPEWEDCSS